MNAFEFKWSPKAKEKFSRSFLQAYPGTTAQLIHSGNFEKIIFSKEQ